MDDSGLDKELWEKLKKAFFKILLLEADQVHPDLTLDDFGIDSLDGVQLWLEFSEIIDVDFDEDTDPIEEILAPSTTLREIHDWFFKMRQAAADELNK